MPAHKPSSKGMSQRRWTTLLLVIGVILVSLLSLQRGSMETSFMEVGQTIVSALLPGGEATGLDSRIRTVVLEIRMPRMLMALAVGAALATAGACLQGLFRNPLADPGLIGVSSGGAIGSIVAISTLGMVTPGSGLLSELYIPILAASGALATTFLVYHVARIAGKTHISTLLLAGIAVNALAGAIVGAILYMSDNDALRRFTFWTLGSLHTTTWRSFLLLAPFVVIPLLIMPKYRRAMNAFLLGEAEAYHLGFNTQQVKRILILLCALMVGVTVAFCGLIGFIGLVVPHLARMIYGPDFRRLLPISALTGSLLVMSADLLARTVNAPAEIPIGVVTSLVGAPFFLYLIYRRKRQLAV